MEVEGYEVVYVYANGTALTIHIPKEIKKDEGQ